MGYYSTVSGELEITPPLKWGEYKDSRFVRDPECTLTFTEYHQERHTATGVHAQRSAVAVVPRWEDAMRYYALDGDFTALVKEFPNHQFTGWLVRSGAERGDVERYGIQDGKVVVEQARMTWPDGSVVES